MLLLIHRTVAFAAIVVLGLLALSPPPAMAQARPDLVVTAVTNPPTTGLPGDSFLVTATVKNQGTAAAGATSTKFFLVAGDGTTKNLKGVQTIVALPAASSNGPQVTVAIFADTLPGTYRLRACADANNAVIESVETNNCRTTTATIVVADVPDLKVTVLTEPAAGASVGQGQSFVVNTTTVRNVGGVPALASNVKYYMVPVVTGPKIDLKGSLAVPALPGSTSFTDKVTLTVRPETPLGQFKLQACADSGKVVSEEDENNNCLTTTNAIRVTPQADLAVTAASVDGLPKTVNAGDPITVSATVKNVGTTDIGATVMKFSLVHTTLARTKNLKGTPALDPIVAGGTASVTGAIVNVYSDTPSGTYHVEACADSTKVVAEISEGNNCFQAAGVLTVVGKTLSTADLVVSTITNPPATIVAGGSFNVTATIKNNGTGPAPATNTRFSLIGAGGGAPPKKNVKGVQAVGALAAGASGGPAVAITLYTDTVPGQYFLQACADGDEALIETAEGNNCKNSANKVQVNDVPDLEITAVGNPPATAGQGGTFKVTSTVKNVGPVDAATSEIKYYLVPIAAGPRIDLKGTGTAPLISPSQIFTDEHDVTVRGETVPGVYTLLACADSGKVVPEREENNNCLGSTGTVTISATPDLQVTSVSVPSPQKTVSRGGTFDVTSIVKNAGGAVAGASSIRFSLIKTGAAAPARNLTGTQAVGALAGGASTSTLVTTVTVPTTGTWAAGLYAVQACADFEKLVEESVESNNCATSPGTVNIAP